MTEEGPSSTPFLDGLNDLIVGLDPDGAPYPIGKLEAHRRSTLHRAVSIFVLDGDYLLLQRRADGKYHSPGLWANSACSHPLWEEDTPACATRTLMRELGMSVPLRKFASVHYEAPVGRLFENEFVDCFVGSADRHAEINFDPKEVAAIRWAKLDLVQSEIGQEPDRFAAWTRSYLQQGLIQSLKAINDDRSPGPADGDASAL